jgi:hypothetical protein
MRARRLLNRRAPLTAGPADGLAAGSSTDEDFETRPFLKIRKGYLDILAAGRRKNIIHGLIEIDVTSCAASCASVSR